MLWAHTAGIVSPVNVELPTSVDALLMAVLGGSGTLVGGVIGTFIVFGLREYLSTLVPWWQYVLGVVYVRDDPLSADRTDGHSGAAAAAARASGDRDDGEAIGTRDVLTSAEVATTRECMTMTSTLRRDSVRCCWAAALRSA